MKKERNCGCGGNGAPYPVYPTYPGMMPMNQGMGMYPMNQGIMPNQIGMPNNIMIGNDYNTLVNQVNNIERRVSRLENMMNSNNSMTPKYSESNYYMV